ncbi:uncharacterized aarF domain-containing protein kinase At5g05200, chloroplastic-like isoform X2 [Durio zibethinus]|uniref:Uncharacterized aarF domain-containing protein kinase At5g05200, chloroplastic-like isoform X2 n=1 Tax=Durio zibethinus TaxID=66656 RepID=A0A6P5YRU7_DURZI|nr:uncharacterized aarF domain-containing protein kinase At5g05200, chloroplastic-like isoform X2 [Durio zibethinus]
MAVSAFRSGRLPSFHHPQLPNKPTAAAAASAASACTIRSIVGLKKLNGRSNSNSNSNSKFQYSQPSQSQTQQQDRLSSRLQSSIENLPKLVEDIVQTSISTGPRGALRLAQGIQAFVGVGGEWLADVSRSTDASTGIPSQLQLGLLSPLYLRKLFERMGATYIKLGQFIASAPTLFPPEYVEEFQKCFDRAPPVPFEDIQMILHQELGRPIDSIYEYINRTPIASASIAQVGIVEDIWESMLEEVDFNKEATNIESFRRYLEAMGLMRQATAPRVYKHCSTQRVLTMERLYGVPLTDLDTISSLVPSPENSLITALNVWFGSLLACETFHADVHVGNLWLLRDGRIGFLDFGIVGCISPKTWAAMEVFLASIATEEYESMASASIEMGATNKDIDAKAFAGDLEKIFSSMQASIWNPGCLPEKSEQTISLEAHCKNLIQR